MRHALLLAALALAAPTALSLPVPALDVADEFDRSDAVDVGNGWQEHEASRDALRVEGGRLTFYDRMGTNRWGLAYRPMLVPPTVDAGLMAPVTVSFDVGAGAANNAGGRVVHGFNVLDDGLGNGYGLRFTRSSVGYANSGVLLMDNGAVVASVKPPRELPATFTVRATFHADGTVHGAIEPPGGTPMRFAFTEARNPVAAGANLALYMVEFHDASPRPTLDNFRATLLDR